MARTAIQEQFGDVVDKVIGIAYSLRLPSGYPGCARFYVLRPTSDNLVITLPDARLCKSGGLPLFTIANMNASAYALDIKDSAATRLAAPAANTVTHLYLIDNSTAAGTWTSRTFSATEGTVDEPDDLVAFTVNVGTTQNFRLRDWIDANTDYDGVSPAHITCTVTGVIGSNFTNQEAFYSGSWPADSRLTLIVNLGSFISGKGGDGGRGGDVVGLLAIDGSDGGPGLGLELDTTLINNGTIQGGGGGGGATAKLGTHGGAGGGGGAGRPGGQGGSQGSGLQDTFGDGGIGSILAGGVGGHLSIGFTTNRGGDGGSPGGNGNTTATTSSSAGSGGDAIRILTGFTLTKTVAGTILGAEVTV